MASIGRGQPMKSIDERIRNLPPAVKREVEKFVAGLLKKRTKENGKKVRQAGATKTGRNLNKRMEAKISELEHLRILRALEAVSALSLEKGPPVTNRDHDRYLYGGQ